MIDENENKKVVFDLLIEDKKQTKRISSKIIKMDKNNQYGMAMAKPLPYGCIKKKKDQPPTLAEFSKILNEISHKDSVGHLLIVDIKFNDINPKTLLFNELHPPIFEKNKKRNLTSNRPFNF